MMLKSIYYGGVLSDTLGLYVLNCNTYNSSDRDINFVSVPGNSGDNLSDNRRYNNLTISYEVVLRPVPNKTLEQQIAEVKNWLYQSGYSYSYKRLSDTYISPTMPSVSTDYPSQFRWGIFVGPIDWEIRLRTYGRTTLDFRCRPELYSGDTFTAETPWIGTSSFDSINIPASQWGNLPNITHFGLEQIKLSIETSEPIQAQKGFRIVSGSATDADYYNIINWNTGNATATLSGETNLKYLYINTHNREITTVPWNDDHLSQYTINAAYSYNQFILRAEGTWFADIKRNTTDTNLSIYFYNILGVRYKAQVSGRRYTL